MVRETILKDAIRCVCVERKDRYGEIEDNFGKIAKLWNAYLGDTLFDAHDVAMCMALMKIARIKTGIAADSYVDLAGYAACAGEIYNEQRLQRNQTAD